MPTIDVQFETESGVAGTIRAPWFSVERAMGVGVSIRVELDNGTWNEVVEDVAEAVGAGDDVCITVRVDGEGVLPPALLRGVTTDATEPDVARFIATAEVVPKVEPDPYQARWRVLSGATLRDIAGHLNHLIAPSPSVSGRLAEKTADVLSELGDDLVWLQHGESDWSTLLRFLRNIRDRHEFPPTTPFVDLSDLDNPRWSLIWARPADHDLNDGPVELPAYEETIAMGTLHHDRAPGAPYHSDTAPVAVVERIGEFDTSVWRQHMECGLPVASVRFASGAIVGTCDAVMTDGDGLRWESRLLVAPEDRPFGLPPGAAPRAVHTTALVTSSEPTAPTIELTLDGYEGEAADMQARLWTPYSGEAGVAGVHFVPVSGSRVAIVWSGTVGDSPLMTGNVREEDADEASPFLGLDRALVARFADVEVRKVELVTVESDLESELRKRLVNRTDGDVSLTGGGKWNTEVTDDWALKTGATALVDANEVDTRSTGAMTLNAGGDARVASNANLDLVGGGLKAALQGGRMDVG